jgi:repressor LexA
MPPDLTARQKQVYEFLLKAIREKGYAPSIAEIGARFKIASTNGVSEHLRALEKKGYIRRIGRRAIEIRHRGEPFEAPAKRAPILGRIAAGRPRLSEENVEGHLSVPPEMARGEVFVLRVQGDSMEGAAIIDGDYVVVRSQSTAENGEIVCALVDGEATLKRFYREGERVTLKAENEKYEPITLARGELRILGKVVGLIRRF